MRADSANGGHLAGDSRERTVHSEAQSGTRRASGTPGSPGPDLGPRLAETAAERAGRVRRKPSRVFA
ncbi:hypothetical protein IscW_ISCW022233 [Ixodes scapularis]|uniref:Uncharacterized protein n=1 Tax=Ixodes scapularis TaxID=6945 RepID=B7QEN8_IXOSC|nr:hypothetical protein IscW_ISCW022233 [Ixodes scapularis]|eukprot:XP_002414002.1 hypothetical protein IscW_ISCW022233 [Ixodes scapularis]